MSNEIKILHDYRWRDSNKLFFIISLGLTILSYLVYKKNGKSLEVYFLSVLTIIFYLSYFILIFVGPR